LSLKHFNYRKYRLYGYPFFGVLLYLLFFLINPFESSFKDWENSTVKDVAFDVIGSLIFSIITLETGIQITIFLNKKLPWENKPRKRLALQLLIQLLVLLVIFSFAFLLVPQDDRINELIYRQALVIGIIFSLLTTAFLTAEYFFKRMAQSQVEALQQKEAATQFQLEALKTQLDPHFLFNNFSVLTALIEDDKEQAVKYVSVLGSVYRYVLQANKKDLVKLDDELQFINVYFYLYKIRFIDAIELIVNIDNSSKQKRICPMTLQLLIENAIKHNAIDSSNPLKINLSIKEDLIVCRNNILPKQTSSKGFGIGLLNIHQRYSLLTTKRVKVIKENNFFTVEIPLL
jgi:sensor histidine kinase YesM